ncbi:MAG TPA: 8-amino-7-oxononanoate synthase [Geobacteraceae bacterium]|nr:8-amino-7-oxononanoate synthase [Geobacteraceae bacterium]
MSTFREELDSLKKQGLYRGMRLVEGTQQSRVQLDGREVTMLCSNNYLGLADHPLLKEAAVSAVNSYGASSGASRLVSGNMELHEELEACIARFKGAEAALVFNSGYAANTGIIPALAGRGDVIFCDRLNHASIIDGCLLSKAKLVRYPHNDMVSLRRLLAENETRGRRLIVTDGVFSMDGDLARLRELVEMKKEFDALLMVDDAHGTGVLGPTGRGTAEHFAVLPEIDIQMGTLGKALGSFGAYAAASSDIIEYLVNRARSFIFSTSLPPAVLAISIAAIDIVNSREGAALRARLVENTVFFRSALQAAGFDTMGSETQIVPVFAGEPETVMEFSGKLLDNGIFVQGIRPPTVPAGSCRLRCTLMATHSRADLEEAVDKITRAGKEIGVIG